MRIFICEYTTGGGLQSEGLPPSLAREGEMMLAALVSDLSTVLSKNGEIGNGEIIVSRDPRLTPSPLPANFVSPGEGEDIWEFWGRQMEDADALWPLAPETDGAMERLCHMAKKRRRILLASDAETVRITASKQATAVLLSKGGVAVVPVHEAGVEIPSSPGGWVVKPDDGAGAQDTRIFQNKKEVLGWLAEHPDHITQPYIEGEVASLSLLCREGRASLLCCNRQIVTIADGEIRLQAIEVGGMEQHREAFAALGDSIVALLPSLWGYNGVDVICGREGIIVLEINPRLTTSYVGLGESLGVNPAGLVLDLLSGGPLGKKPLPICRPQKTVTIEMDPVKMAELEDE